MAGYKLQPNESMILKSENVMHGGTFAGYTDELLLTNLYVVYISKGMFGNTKAIQKFPINQIKVYEGVPQVMEGKFQNGAPKLDMYFIHGVESFGFQMLNSSEIKDWIYAIYKLVTGQEHPDVIAKKEKKSRHVIPGTAFVAGTLRGTFDTFRDTLGIKRKDEPVVNTPTHITKKCISCSAPLSGKIGDVVHCKYCDTDQVL